MKQVVQHTGEGASRHASGGFLVNCIARCEHAGVGIGLRGVSIGRENVVADQVQLVADVIDPRLVRYDLLQDVGIAYSDDDETNL